MRKWPHRRPTVDESSVGITFVGVLFALVIGEIFTALRDVSSIAPASWAHLGVAGVLTLTSWIGYHNSVNRPRYLIRFPNLPLAQFMLDIAMVVIYWLAAVTVELRDRHGDVVPDATPETRCVAAAFLLYVTWDFVGRQIRADTEYKRRPIGKDQPSRRRVTIFSATIAVTVWAAVETLDPETTARVIGVDVLLVLLLVGFRLSKEYWSPEDPLSPKDERTYVVRRLDEIDGKLERLLEQPEPDG